MWLYNYRRIVLALGVLVFFIPAEAQWSIGGGVGYGTAMFVNGAFFAARPAMSACGDLGYMPGEGRLFPSFSYMLRTTHVQVQNAHFHDLEDLAREQHFALQLNYRDRLEQHYHLFFLGIGVANIRPDKVMSDQYGYDIIMNDTGSIHLYPLVQAGARIMRRILPNSGFYLGLEANVQYVAMHNENRYYLQQGTILVPATIGGDILLPGIAVKLLYVFDKVERY